MYRTALEPDDDDEDAQNARQLAEEIRQQKERDKPHLNTLAVSVISLYDELIG